MTENVTGKSPQIYVFSHPRTASNLFCKLFSQHPSVNLERYPFLFAHNFGPEAQHQVVGKNWDEFHEMYANIAKDMTYQASLDIVQTLLVETRKAGKILMLKDHTSFLTMSKEVQSMLDRPRKVAPEPKLEDRFLDLPENEREDLTGSPNHELSADILNPTVLPDRMLRTFVPVFTIRHPIKQIESWYRASRITGMRPDEPDFELLSSYRFTKRLFDYYAELYQPRGGSPDIQSNEPRWPIVIDGDDLINNTEGIANRFCDLSGLDPRGVIYKWESEEASTDPIDMFFFGTMRKSDGVKRDKELKVPDISEASIKWSEDWGSDVGKALVEFVKDIMPDYEYLHQYRLKSRSV